MTYRSTAAAAEALPRPDLWGVFRYRSAGGGQDYPVGYEDFERDVRWAGTFLADHEVGRGSVVCFVGRGSQGPWLQPLMEAARRARVMATYAGDWPAESRRVASLVHRLRPSAVIGLSGPVVDGVLGEAGTKELLAAVPTVLADVGTVAALEGAGVTARRMAFVGPALALDCYEGGLHVNSGEWDVVAGEHGLAVSTKGPRAHVVDGLDVLFDAGVDTARCLCGRADVRLVPHRR